MTLINDISIDFHQLSLNSCLKSRMRVSLMRNVIPSYLITISSLTLLELEELSSYLAYYSKKEKVLPSSKRKLFLIIRVIIFV